MTRISFVDCQSKAKGQHHELKIKNTFSAKIKLLFLFFKTQKPLNLMPLISPNRLIPYLALK